MAEFVEVRINCGNCRKYNVVVLSSSSDSEPLCEVCGNALFQYRGIHGYIYVLSNPRMPGVLKIGFTTRRVEDRVQELNAATGVPSPFTIEAWFASPDPQKHEYDVYRALQDYKVGNKEFFELDLSEALSEIEAVIGSPPQYSRQPFPPKTPSISKITAFYCRKCKGQHMANYALERCPSCGGEVGIL